MDEKTESLRDIFLDVSDEETVTESQAEERGTLADRNESVEDRLRETIRTMREKFDFSSSLAAEQYPQVVRSFYAGEDDEEIAAELDCSTGEVFEARLDLHLVRGSDIPEAIEEDLAEQADTDVDTAELADRLGVDQTLAGRARQALDAERRSRLVSYRFRTAFEETLTDADLTVQFAADAHADGLEEATEDAEVDVDF